MPEVPFNPDYSACASLSAELSAKTGAAYRESNQCMNSKSVKFGTCPHGGSTAYLPCCDVSTAASRLSNEASLLRSQCHEKAKLRSERERLMKADNDKKEKEMAEAMNRGNTLAERAMSITKLIQNPSNFFRNALSPNSSEIKQLFGNSEGIVRPDVGEELYRYVHNLGNAGAAGNPIIGKIQRGSLDELDRYHKNLMSDLNGAVNDLESAGDFTSFKPKSDFKPSPPVVRHNNGQESRDADCTVFSNLEASRRLMSNDFTRWAELNEKCNQR
jgi:hypothetical protein